MLIESKAHGPAEDTHCHVCIVGAGPAGITLALSLARRGCDVVLIESGELRTSRRIQRLADAAELDEDRHAPMNVATQRGWGGTSRIWGGRCVPLDRSDFDNCSSSSLRLWPIKYDELARYYPEACRFALCGSSLFDVRTVFGDALPPLVPGLVDGAEIVTSTLERWSLPTNFGKTYEAEARARRNLRAYLGFTCVSLRFDPTGDRVDGLVARSIDGRQLTIHARQVVLAAGGLESTRLLMNSDSVHAGGVGNHSDLLGRCYMGHVSGKIAEIQFTTPERQTRFGFERDADGIFCRRRFVLSEKARLDHGLSNCAMWLDNPPLPSADHRNGILSLAYLALGTPVLSRLLAPEAIRQVVMKHPRPSPRSRHLWNVAADLPQTVSYLVPFVWKRYFAHRKLPGFFLRSSSNRYALHYHGEHLPDPSSRVSLSKELDELGSRKLKIDIRYSPTDVASVRKTHELLDAYLRRLQIGYLVYGQEDASEAILRQAKDGTHQIGTTRMSTDPEHGVVDPNCRVHTVQNLYVASSSVFPTSGQANPTLTIIALSLRLADHLYASRTSP